MNNQLLSPEDRVTLEDARVLLDRGWCKELSARDREGKGCSPWGESAVNYCAVGSLWRAAYDKDGEPISKHQEKVYRIVQYVQQFLPSDVQRLADYNDHEERKKEDILSLFDKALTHARPETP